MRRHLTGMAPSQGSTTHVNITIKLTADLGLLPSQLSTRNKQTKKKSLYQTMAFLVLTAAFIQAFPFFPVGIIASAPYVSTIQTVDHDLKTHHLSRGGLAYAVGLTVSVLFLCEQIASHHMKRSSAVSDKQADARNKKGS